MANMIPIATVVVGSGGASTINFASIPQTYTDLLCKISARSTLGNGSYLALIPNGSSTSFTSKVFYSNVGIAAYTGTGADLQYAGYISAGTASNSTFSNTDVYFSDYASSKFKTIYSDSIGANNATSEEKGMGTLIWSNTSPITSITFDIFDAGDFAQYSTATLYGIRKY